MSGRKTLDIVSRHERDGADMEVASACAGDLERGIRGVCRSGEAERELFIGRRNCIQRYHLAVIRPATPYESDLDVGSWSAADNNVTDVSLTLL